MTKPYRIKHKASGYFYQRYNGSNLGKKGKVYMNNQSPLTMCDNENFIRIQIRHNTLAYKALRDMLSKYAIGKDDECEWHSTSYRVTKSEFEKEELQLMKIENIKFKAKRLDNAELVKGYFYQECGNTYIIEDRQKDSMLNRNEAVLVDPSTVCQFTGLKDCKGKEIFEHDIIHFVGHKPIGEVIWSEEDYAFMIASKYETLYLLSDVLEIGKIERVGNKFDKNKQRMRVQTTFNDKLKKHSSHHAFIPDWMHDCVEWDDCNILIEKVEQKNKQRMKIRLAKKIMKPSLRNGKIGYWHSRYDLYCMGFDGCGDHRITKAISLTKKKQLMEKKILTLTVSKQWFDMIVAGEKTEEYRAIKSYWINRLLQAKHGESDEYRKVAIHPEFDMLISNSKLKELLKKETARFIPYTHVLFINGYRKDSPRIEKEIESITIGKPKKGLCPDKWLNTEFFIIKFK